MVAIRHLLYRLIQFVKFYATANTIFQAHSPFVYSFCKNILEDTRQYYLFGKVASIQQKRQLFAANRVNQPHSSIRFSIFIFRLVNYYKPNRILLINSKDGSLPLFICKSQPQAELICIGTLSFQQELNIWKRALQFTNEILVFIHSPTKSFGTLFKIFHSFELIIFDLSNQENIEPKEFEEIFSHISKSGIIIIKGIHVSKAGKQVRALIKKEKKLSIELFLWDIGLFFFEVGEIREKLEQQLIPLKCKPWKKYVI